MKYLPVCLLALAPLLAWGAAQAQQPSATGEAKSFAMIMSEEQQARQAMREEVEILRRILNQKLGLPRLASGSVGSLTINHQLQQSLAGPAIGANPEVQAANPTGSWDTGFILGGNQQMTAAELPEVDGVYLKGTGVVYTLVLPPQSKQSKAEPKPQPKPLTDWERTKKEMRGEKAEAEAKPAPAPEPSLVDKLISILADNGSHFSKLAENERLTIVVTFRQPASHPISHWLTPAQGSNTYWSAPAQGGSNSLLRTYLHDDPNVQSLEQGTAQRWNTYPVELPFQTPTGNAAQGLGSASTDKPTAGNFKDSALLGDLEAKQGRHKEAIKAYEEALRALGKEGDAGKIQEILKKLAASQIADGRIEEAKSTLNKIGVKKTEQTPVSKPKPAVAPYPPKLLVSVSKNTIAALASGKMSREEFAKAVIVERDE